MSTPTFSLTFLGAARTVTGSMHLLEADGHSLLVDCGMFQGRRQEALARNRQVPRGAVQAEAALLTHAHIDHAGGTAELARRLQLPIIGPHRGDKFWIDGIVEQGRMFGFPRCETFEPDRWLDEGDRVQVGDVELEVRHCPGHTPGHVIFYSAADKLAFVGDVLFQGSIGRTDFPGGDYATLIRAIREKLFTLGDDVRFVPGHGPMSTFGEERRSNPFAGDAAVGK
jgi:glyoxylase-like metal-dependent hydrolase (beta-lactamase superfamily II)